MLRGLAQFERTLKDLENSVSGEVLKKALLRAVQPTVEQAAANAPRGTGALGRSMTAQAMSYSTPREAIVRVGPGRPEGSHGILLEHGTIYMTPRPFLADAFRATAELVINEFENELEDEITNG